MFLLWMSPVTNSIPELTKGKRSIFGLCYPLVAGSLCQTNSYCYGWFVCRYQWIYLWEQGNSVYRNPSPMVHVFMAFHVPHWVLHIINTYAIWLLKPRGIHLLFLIPQTCKSAFICSNFGRLLSLLTLLDHSQYCVMHICFWEGTEPYSDLFKKKKTPKQTKTKIPKPVVTLGQMQFFCSVSLECLVVDSSAMNPVPVYCIYLRNNYKIAVYKGNRAPRDTLYPPAQRYRLRAPLHEWHCSLDRSHALLLHWNAYPEKFDER